MKSGSKCAFAIAMALPVTQLDTRAGVMTGLHVVGDKILNGAGQQVQMLGINRSGFEYMCIDKSSGGANVDGPADQAEINAMKGWHINSVRVPLNEDCWLGNNGLPASGAPKYRQDVSAYVALLTRNDMSVIVNLHFSGNGKSAATGQQPMANRTHSLDFWASVAAAFKGNSAVLFEPYNEPHSITWNCWRDGGCPTGGFVAAGMQEMVNAIRSAGASNIIVVTGNNWGSDISQWAQYAPSDPLGQLAAGWHSYGDGLSCQNLSCWNSTMPTVLAKAPILATEIGEFDCAHAYIDAVMDWLDTHDKQGYYAWSWGAHSCSEDPALLTDWSGTPTTTYGSAYRDHLLSRSPVAIRGARASDRGRTNAASGPAAEREYYDLVGEKRSLRDLPKGHSPIYPSRSEP